MTPPRSYVDGPNHSQLVVLTYLSSLWSTYGTSVERQTYQLTLYFGARNWWWCNNDVVFRAPSFENSTNNPPYSITVHAWLPSIKRSGSWTSNLCRLLFAGELGWQLLPNKDHMELGASLCTCTPHTVVRYRVTGQVYSCCVSKSNSIR